MNGVKFKWLGTIFLILVTCTIHAQKPEPPIPIEAFFGNEALYFQLVVKKKFTPESRFNFFTVATYTADYENNPDENSIVMPVQLSYDVAGGFGIMAGTDINSISGFSAIVGPQFNYASKEWLIVNVASIFLNEDNDFKLFGLYEYKPAFNETWSLYTRVQYIFNRNLKLGTNNQKYLYLRAGLKKDRFIFGLAANIEQSGPLKKKVKTTAYLCDGSSVRSILIRECYKSHQSKYSYITDSNREQALFG
ncbi:hypothetical protein [[Muricauda] lutisoli]|uniref:DUF4421 domain-containing protein n=1 Tax=[Muricauda] lutisoli TaxID=2816035 RepID=A0ABS3EYE3_9FLAO|nr:hypothetical protein [[Muricauda] lutisoli]MBO0331142.1 hypothetical protein [[Muricauda] lutisoli]